MTKQPRTQPTDPGRTVVEVMEALATALGVHPDDAVRVRRIGRVLAEAAQEAKVSSASDAAGASAGRPTGYPRSPRG